MLLWDGDRMRVHVLRHHPSNRLRLAGGVRLLLMGQVNEEKVVHLIELLLELEAGEVQCSKVIPRR